MSWKKVKINEVGFVQGGYAFASTEYKEVGVPLIRISNIHEDEIEVNSNTVFVDENYLDTKKDFLVTKGDVLIAMSGATTGKFGVYKLNMPSLLNQRVGRIKLNNNTIDRKYFYYFMFQIQKLILRNSYGAAIPNISPTDIASLQIPLPPRSTQHKIAAILDKADELRRKDKVLLTQYDALLQSIFYNMFGDPVKNEKGWEIKRVEDVLSTDSDGTKCGPFGSALKKHEYTSDRIPVWVMDNINDTDFIEEGALFVSNKKYIELNSYQVKNGDIIISRAGTVGKMAVVNTTHKLSIISTNLIKLSLNQNYISPHYFIYLLKFSEGGLGRLKKGNEGAFTHMNTGIIKSLEIPIPNISLQKNFERALLSINFQKQQIKQQIQQSQNLFQSLLQKSFKEELISEE